jgi:hypothetical protein
MPYCTGGFLRASTHGEEVAVVVLGSRLDPPSTRLPGRPEVCGEAALCTMFSLGWSMRVVRSLVCLLFRQRGSAGATRRGACRSAMAVLGFLLYEQDRELPQAGPS